MSGPTLAACGPNRRIRVYSIIGLLIFLNTLIVYFVRVNISVVAPEMMKELGWDIGIMGVAMSMFGVGYMITQVPGGMIADKYGGRGILGIGSVLWSLCTLLTPFALTPASMYCARTALGLAEGVSFPAETSVLAQWLPRKARARFQGFNLSAIAAGPLVATPLSVWIMSAFGWQAVFYSFAAVGLLWSAVWMAYSKASPSEHKGVSAEELAEINTGAEDENLEAVDAPLRSTAVWGLTASYFCFTYTFWLFLNWLPTYLVQARGFALIKMGFFAAIPWLATFLSINFAGWICDALVKRGVPTWKSRRLLIYLGLPGMAVSLWFAARADNAYAAVCLITVTMMLTGVNYPSFWSLPMDMHPRKSGLISGIMNTGSAVGSILAPVLTGYISILWGWSVSMYIASGMAILSVAIIYATAPKSPQRP